jgi:hypothetical protein
MKKWTQAQMRDPSIVDYEQFNKEYNGQKGAINTGLSRTELPGDFVTRPKLANKSMHEAYVVNEAEFAYLSDTGSGNKHEFRGLTYKTYNSGWIPLFEETYSDLKSGMVHVEFRTHLLITNEFDTSSAANEHGVRFRIKWDGNVIAQTGNYLRHVQTIKVFGDTYSTSGDKRLVVEVAAMPRSTVDWLTKVVFHCWGTSHLVIARYR